jgi:hypothetical protein
VIVPFREEPETRLGYPCRAFRWTFQVTRDFVGFLHQHELGGAWYDSHTRVNGVWFYSDRPWQVRFSHLWYDGPHCALRLGPLTIQWNNPGCRRCLGEVA